MCRYPIRSLVALACLSSMAWSAMAASVPGHPGVDQLPSCTADNLEAVCRIAVPNGDFAGYSGDDYYHGEFRMWALNSRTHSITRHIVPWVYDTKGDASFLRGKAKTFLTLPHSGDRVAQWIELPTQVNDTDVMYTLHVHIRGEHAEAGAGAGLFLHDGDAPSVLKSVVKGMAQPGVRGQHLLGTLVVPAGTMGGRLALVLAVPTGAPGNLVVDDVVLVRSKPGSAAAMWAAL